MKKLAFRIVALAFSWAVIELFSFAALKIYFPSPVTALRPLGSQAANIFRPNSRLDHHVHPFLGFVLKSQAASAKYGWNEFGFMDNQTPIVKRSPDKVIVALTGGSVANQLSQFAADPLLAELGKSPLFQDREIRLVKLGLNGFRQPQQLMTLAWFLALGGEFDVVINLDGFNEIYLQPYANTGFFHAYPAMWPYGVSNLPEREYGEYQFRLAQEREFVDGLYKSRAHHSPLLRLMMRFFHRRLRWDIAQAEQTVVREARIPEWAKGPRREYVSRLEASRESVGLWRRASLQIAALCTAHGARYFHLLQPNQYVEGSKPMGAAERRIAIDPEQSFAEAARIGYPLLIEAGRELIRRGVLFADLTRIYADHPEPVYGDACCHFNEHGRNLLAVAVARFVLDNFDGSKDGGTQQPE